MSNKTKNKGHIVRISLENFMSYDKIDIHPGSQLNLVIGPNGTGKSSIVCAVFLCLNGKLKDLGRADQLSSFVKSGCFKSSVEVELYNPDGNNVIVRREITSSNESQFKLNGVVCKPTNINDIRKKYNIQIGNLCTFLPQEKVQDFAKLNSRQLLDQTQRVVGNGELAQLHEQLKTLQSDVQNQINLNTISLDNLENEKQKNDRLKDKVKGFKEKQLLYEKIDDLNRKKAWIFYVEETEKKREIDNDAELAETAHDNNLEKIRRCNDELKEFERNSMPYQQKLNEAKKNEAGKKSCLENLLSRTETRLFELEELRNDLNLKLKEEENKKKEISKYKENLQKLTNDLKNFDEQNGPMTDLVKEKEKCNQQLKEFHMQEVQLNSERNNLEEEEDTLQQERRNTETELGRLEKRRDIRLEFLRKVEPDVYKSIEWLKQNRHLFHSRIYDPMLLELDVPNPKMAKFIENRISFQDLISFTCTNPDDLNLMIKKLRTEQNLKINVICSDEYDSTQYYPEVPLNDIRGLGFFAYMNELIQGPEEILRFLCKTYRIHSIPVGDERVSANRERVPAKIQIFYSENHVFSVKNSIYSGERSTTVRKLGEPKHFSHSIDERRIQFLSETKKNLMVSINNKQNEIKLVDDKIKDLRKKVSEVKNNLSKLATTIGDRHSIETSLKVNEEKFRTLRSKLRDPAVIKTESNTKRQKLLEDIECKFKDIKEASKELEKATLFRQKQEIKYKINKVGVIRIKENKSKYEDKCIETGRQLKLMKDLQREAEYKCQKLKEDAMKLTKGIAIDQKEFRKFREIFRTLPETIEAIESEIEETKAKADYLQGGNLQILRDYEEREKRIEQLTKLMENSIENLEKKKSEFSSKRNEWLNPVTDLVSKINLNFGKFFEAMNCAGEVSFDRGQNEDDFQDCGLKIKVKFRNDTPFHELGRFFQSGGERAVSIAIFLLSLQELTSVPFRFVDEINQGMDPENERRIVELIIRVTSPKNSPQYFFITPKLLSNIKCSRSTTVLCIYNGPYAMSATEWNMKNFLDGLENEDYDKDGSVDDNIDEDEVQENSTSEEEDDDDDDDDDDEDEDNNDNDDDDY